MSGSDVQRIRTLIAQGVGQRKLLLGFGIVSGILVGPGLLVWGLLTPEPGLRQVMLLFGGLFTVCLILLAMLVHRQGSHRRRVLAAVMQGSEIDRIHLLDVRTRGGGPEGYGAERYVAHHVFIGIAGGPGIHFALPREAACELAGLLIRAYPGARRYVAPAHLADVVRVSGRLAPHTLASEGEARRDAFGVGGIGERCDEIP